MELSGKRTLVTGGGSGIGLAIARRFKNFGATVYVTDIDEHATRSAKQEGLIGGVFDAAKEQDVRDLVHDVERQLGGLDVLVNNVGVAGPTGPVESYPAEAWTTTFDANVHSHFYCVKHALPLLRGSGNASIINMSSAAGRLGMAGRSAYSASKWAVIGFTKTLAIELGEHGIRVNAICPGAVAGARIDSVIEAKARMLGRTVAEVAALYKNQASLTRMVSETDVANMAVFLASDMSGMVHGQAMAVDGNTEKLF